MKYQIIIEKSALDDINYFKKHNQIIVKKIQNLLLDLGNHPFTGRGKPEALKFELSGYWSKRISKEHRIIYKVKNDVITVISCRYHY